MFMVPCIADLHEYLSSDMQQKAVNLLFCKFTVHVRDVNHTNYQDYTKL